jgi:quercetin dioxygenase-like cupin family protein
MFGGATIHLSRLLHRSRRTQCTSRETRSTSTSDQASGSPAALDIDTIATASEPSRAAAALVHFPPGVRPPWHTHP